MAHVYLLHVLLTIVRLRNPWLTKLTIDWLIGHFIHVICDGGFPRNSIASLWFQIELRQEGKVVRAILTRNNLDFGDADLW